MKSPCEGARIRGNTPQKGSLPDLHYDFTDKAVPADFAHSSNLKPEPKEVKPDPKQTVDLI